MLNLWKTHIRVVQKDCTVGIIKHGFSGNLKWTKLKHLADKIRKERKGKLNKQQIKDLRLVEVWMLRAKERSIACKIESWRRRERSWKKTKKVY